MQLQTAGRRAEKWQEMRFSSAHQKYVCCVCLCIGMCVCV